MKTLITRLQQHPKTNFLKFSQNLYNMLFIFHIKTRKLVKISEEQKNPFKSI